MHEFNNELSYLLYTSKTVIAPTETRIINKITANIAGTTEPFIGIEVDPPSVVATLLLLGATPVANVFEVVGEELPGVELLIGIEVNPL